MQAEAQQYRQWFHDPDVTKYNSHGLFPYTKEQMAKFLAQLESSDNLVWAVMAKPEEKGRRFAKYEKHGLYYLDGLHIGNITLQQINWIYRSAEFACVFGKKNYWGKGYGTEAAKMIFNHGFKRLNLHRIWTGTASTNIGMQKIAGKLGMKKEGVFKEAMFLNGEWIDIVEYGILAKDWVW